MTIALVDTSVLCELLSVPMCHQDPKHFAREFKRRREREKHTFFLPVATILETGNHIGQHGDGRQKREAATRFIRLIGDAVEGVAPFVPSRFIDGDQLVALLARFPDWAMQGSGLGDLTIVAEWELTRARSPKRRVYIWSLDEHLQGYDTGDP